MDLFREYVLEQKRKMREEREQDVGGKRIKLEPVETNIVKIKEEKPNIVDSTFTEEIDARNEEFIEIEKKLLEEHLKCLKNEEIVWENIKKENNWEVSPMEIDDESKPHVNVVKNEVPWEKTSDVTYGGNVMATHTPVESFETPTFKNEPVDDWKNRRDTIHVVKTETETCAPDSKESPFLPIGIQDSSIDISDLEADNLDDGFTRSFKNENCNLVDAETETKSPILVGETEKCQDPRETYYTAEYPDSDDSDDDCVIIEEIYRNKNNKLLHSKPNEKLTTASENIEKSSPNSSVEILNRASESVESTQEPRYYTNNDDWDFLLGPLQLKYRFRINLGNKAKKDKRRKESVEDSEEDMFADW